MIKIIALIFLVIFLVLLSGFFSGAETGMYKLSLLRLRLGIEKKKPSFLILAKALNDSPAILITILIGTNLTNYVITSIVTYIFLNAYHSTHTAELLTTLCVAPVLFVFSELIPKNIFFYCADTIMPRIAPLLWGTHKLFTWCGILPILKGIQDMFTRLHKWHTPIKTRITSALPHHHIRAILHETREEAFLSPIQENIIDRMINISNINIDSVMTPISRTHIISCDLDKAALLKKLKKTSFTRLPVYEHRQSKIIGFVNIYEALSSSGQFEGLQSLINPIKKLSANTTVSDAINIMRSENQKIILATKKTHTGHIKPVGIVTMKDLVEELLGELAEW